VDVGIVPADALKCPDARNQAYQFFAANYAQSTIARDMVVAADPDWSPEGPGLVLLGDGTVLNVKDGGVAEAIARTGSREER
jgi:hypothetical protein